MLFLAIFFAFIAIYYGAAGLPMMFDKGIGYFVYALFIEAIMLALFVFFLAKYLSSGKLEQYLARREHKRKEAEKAREAWEASAPERERQRREQQARLREIKRLRTTVVSTRLIGKGSIDVGSVITRGVVGGFLGGTNGAALGAATAMNKSSKRRRFLVKYLDGHVEEREATVGSPLYDEYMAHLEEENY